VQLLEANQMADLFVELLTAEDHPRKPDPAAFLTLMAHHRMSPAETLAVGDRALDIEAGQNAGVATCFFGEEIPAGLTPNYAVTSYADLEAILFPQ
jgi:FMN phosphatase YigB (HAD superfamily)